MKRAIKKLSITTCLYLFLTVAAIILYALTLSNHIFMETCFLRGGYYLIALLVVLWLITLLRSHCITNFKLFIKSYQSGLIFSLVLASIVFISIRPRFRVLSDETNLLAISQSMTYDRGIENVTMGAWYYETFHPIKAGTPKRPLLFPFLAHILHTILGYRAENVFILNFLVFFFLCFLIYVLLKNQLGNVWAFSAMILVASQPIVSQAATSGGYDLLCVLFILICFACLKWFLKDPLIERFELLWMSLLMLANTRYEGILYLAIVMLSIAFLRYIKKDFFKNGVHLIYVCTPFILLLTFWQRLLIKEGFEAVGASPFSAVHFIRHNIIFFRSLFHYDFFLPYATLVNFIGFLSFLYFAVLFLSKKVAHQKNQKHLILISALSIGAYWVLHTSFHFGKMDQPSHSRVFILGVVLLSLASIMLIREMKLFKKKPVYVLILSILMFLLYHPVSIKDQFSKGLTLPREYTFTMNFFKLESKKNRNFFIISKRPGHYTAQNYGAADFLYANIQSESIIIPYRRHLVEKIFVIQDIDYRTLQPTQETQLDKQYVLETIAESQNNFSNFTRISKVVSINKGH